MIEFSGEVLEKAKRLSDEAVEEDKDYPLIWWVEGSGGNRYRVQVGMEGRRVQYVTCTCPHGLNTGAGETHCYHAAAVLMRLRDRQQPLGESNGIDEGNDRGRTEGGVAGLPGAGGR